MSEHEQVRILIVDDHQIMRDGLRMVLGKEEGFEVIGEASTGYEAIAMVEQLKPDVIVMDVSMPDLNGIEATKMIKSKLPAIKIIALSIHGNERYISKMLQSGADGYLVKNCTAEELARAVRTVRNDRIYLSADVAGAVVKDYLDYKDSAADDGHAALTSREREILQQLAEGRSTKDIAVQLSLSVKTVECHRQKIMDKLNIHNVVELTRYAIREGISAVE